MSLVEDIYGAFKKIISIEDRIARLSDDMRRLQLDVIEHGERLARLEGKFDLLETSLGSRRRKLPG